MILVEDEIHAEQTGTFPGLEEAMDELRRLAGVPWDQAPNVAPCTSWAECGRIYALVEYTTQLPRRELSRTPALEISANGVRWL